MTLFCLTETERRLRYLTRAASAAAVVAMASGCTVDQATPSGITITANAFHPEYPQLQAIRHCRQFGKKAVLIRTEPVAPSISTLFTRSVLTTFECVTPPLDESTSE